MKLPSCFGHNDIGSVGIESEKEKSIPFSFISMFWLFLLESRIKWKSNFTFIIILVYRSLLFGIMIHFHSYLCI